MALLHRLGLSLLSLLLASCAQGAAERRGQTVVIEHVTVLDGQGGPATNDVTVVVQGGRIVGLSSTSSIPPYRDATIINGEGKFLVPGFIDMHAHLLFPRCTQGDGPPRFDRALSERALSAQLDFGITTVRSPATPTVEGLALRDDLNAGKVRGPHALASAELVNDPSLSDSELRQIVRDALPYKPDYFKVYSRLRPEQVASVVDEASRHHVPVIGHLQRTSWAQGVSLGVDHLTHSVDWSVDSLPVERRAAYVEAAKARPGFRSRIDWLEAFDPDGAEQRKLIADLARRQISVDVTLMAYDGKFSSPDVTRYRRNPYLKAFPELREDWTRCDDVTVNWSADDFRRWQAARPKLLNWIRRMGDGGVLLVTGTDLTNEWITPGDGLHQEFELLAEAGLSPDRILRMTGADAARALGRADIGVVAVGRRADLVLLSGDPREDIRNTRSIVWVMQDGRIVAEGTPRL
jgi:hypothetical protein